MENWDGKREEGPGLRRDPATHDVDLPKTIVLGYPADDADWRYDVEASARSIVGRTAEGAEPVLSLDSHWTDRVAAAQHVLRFRNSSLKRVRLRGRRYAQVRRGCSFEAQRSGGDLQPRTAITLADRTADVGVRVSRVQPEHRRCA